MITIFAGLLVLCLIVFMLWGTVQRPKMVEVVPVEMLELESPGGVEDGSPDETLRVDSPLPERPDASLVESGAEQSPVEAALEAAVEVSDAAGEQVVQTPPQFDLGVKSTGTPGSAKGTGRRALGSGTGTGGFPREQRWFVRFSDRASVEEYGKQIDFFKIELGAILPDGRLAYMSGVSGANPQVRYVQTGADEKRLYFTWQGGERRGADVELFRKANISIAPDAPIFHFYPADLENRLALLEKKYRNKPVKQIRRTYFSVDPSGKGYEPRVTRQLYTQ